MTSGALIATHLGARLDVVAAEIDVAVRDWVGARRRLAADLVVRLGALSHELLVAERRFLGAVGGAPARRREDAWRAFTWVRDFERERQRIEGEVWALVAQARADEAGFRTELGRRSAEVARAPALVVGAMQSALASVLAGDARLGDTELGRTIEARQRDHLAASRQAAERAIAGAEGELARALARGVADWELVNQRFEAALGGTPLPIAPTASRRSVVRAPSGPPRKRARVPKFLLGAFYKRGNLRVSGDDVELTFVNPLAFCIIQNGDPIRVDGREHPAESTLLDNGEKRLEGPTLSDSNYLKYPKGGALKVTLLGCRLAPGKHRFKLSLELRKMGWIDLDVTDEAP